MLKRFNLEAFLKILIFMGFTIFFSYIIVTDKITLYIHPRNIIYVKVSIIGMVLLSLFIIKDIFTTKKKGSVGSYLIFIIPLIGAFLFPAKPLDSNSLASINKNSTEQALNIQKPKDAPLTTPIKESSKTPSTSLESNINSKLELKDNTIVMTDENFLSWLTEIYDNIDKYKGKKIELTAFISKDTKFKKDEFLSSRLMMSCCASDIQKIGFLSRYNKAETLKADTWVNVKGTLDVSTHEKEKVPLILIQSLKNTQKPKQEYIYP